LVQFIQDTHPHPRARHADGNLHQYVDAAVTSIQALRMRIDSKTQ